MPHGADGVVAIARLERSSRRLGLKTQPLRLAQTQHKPILIIETAEVLEGIKQIFLERQQ